MDRWMVTHSLLSSWLYAMRDNPYGDAETEPEDPLAEFKQVLNREPTETTDAMQNGIDFENLVTAITEGETAYGMIPVDPEYPELGMMPMDITDHVWYPSAKKIADIVGGGQLQLGCYKTVQIRGMDIFLYGRLDALKAGSIYDIKFSKSYDRGKYIDSTQHMMYLELVPTAYQFSYLISNGNDVWSETYRRDETKSIIPIITDFLDWLNSVGLMDTYKTKWLAL